MPTAFISYSHRDRDFGGRLARALAPIQLEEYVQ